MTDESDVERRILKASAAIDMALSRMATMAPATTRDAWEWRTDSPPAAEERGAEPPADPAK